jgi:succinoglycan biosynthesis transport protein ExoP
MATTQTQSFAFTPADNALDLSPPRVVLSPTLGFVDPPEPPSPDAALVMVRDHESAAAAGFRTLARRLAQTRVLLVTSAGAGDGKSVAAANLAAALAERGDTRVVLVDACFDRPAAASLFGVSAIRPLGEQLAEHRERPESPWTVMRLYPPSLWLLPATVTEQPLERPHFASAIRQLALSFDHVVIDAPPVLEAAGIDLIQDLADALVLVTRAKRTRASTLQAVLDRIAPTPVAGVLLVG